MQTILSQAVKIEDTRNTIKRFFAEKYEEKVSDYIDNIKLFMDKNRVGPLQALIEISKMPHYQGNGMVQALYVSATYEIITKENNLTKK